MFYAYEPSPVLRFGDVVKGYVSTDLVITEPILSYPSLGNNYKIEIEVPKYSVILTPCCSIGKSTICVAPFIKVLGDFLKNSYFTEDLTRINRPLLPNQLMSTEDWDKLTPERQEQIINAGEEYPLLQYFVYAEHDLFDKYLLRGHEISYYMIDFKNVQKIKCSKIQRPEPRKPLDKAIIGSKILELSIEARRDLREKIAYFFSRVPDEDRLVEEM